MNANCPKQQQLQSGGTDVVMAGSATLVVVTVRVAVIVVVVVDGAGVGHDPDARASRALKRPGRSSVTEPSSKRAQKRTEPAVSTTARVP